MATKESPLPFEVEKALLDTLHGSLMSLAPGTLGVAAVLIVCGYVSQNDALRWSSAFALLAAALRFLTTAIYRRAVGDIARQSG